MELIFTLIVGWLLSLIFSEPKIQKNSQNINSLVEMVNSYQAHGRKNIDIIEAREEQILKNQERILANQDSMMQLILNSKTPIVK